MNTVRKLPVGIENFEEIRTENFYYVDKTGFLKDLLNNWGKVNLFTRPRRFGKSLNMSMLKYFFSYGCDSSLFDGLEIAGEPELCQRYMGKFPVISVSLKDVSAGNYETARGMLCSIIGNEALRFPFLADSGCLSTEEKEQYRRLLSFGGHDEPEFAMGDETLMGSMFTLCRLLYRHYGQKVILLIDEYDVPLDKARSFDYYDEMIHLMRNLFSRALKSNDFLQFAVLTGCLKISKESIFTGLNNLKVFSISNICFGDYFGFSGKEVREMLHYYGLDAKFDTVKEWYDGYRFGNADVYCPWDVVNYVDLLLSEPDAPPKAFWLNTSGNDIIQNFIMAAKPGTRRELELLVNGESVAKKINQELTYRDLYDNTDNLWSVLFMTGYLTQCGTTDADTFLLIIPNREIRKIFIDHILDWFQEEARKDTPNLDAFCAAFPKADAERIERLFNAYLSKTISIRDTNVRKDKKENFYHGILLGLLSHREDWYIRSNAESGNGCDILIEIDEEETGIVIEVKYPDSGKSPQNSEDLDKGCLEALAQIDRMKYDTVLRQHGMSRIIKYGIACDRKKCRVMAKILRTQQP